MDDDLRQIAETLDSILHDTSVPRNVRATVQKAKEKLEQTEDRGTAISGAVYALEEISNDINMPMHTRTMVWNLLSELEAMK